LASFGLLAILAVTASSVLWSLSTSLKKFLSSALSVLTICWMADNRKGHYGEDNNIYLNDTNLNNTKDLATTLGHETSHAIDPEHKSSPLLLSIPS
jgi:hypothetical protein